VIIRVNRRSHIVNSPKNSNLIQAAPSYSNLLKQFAPYPPGGTLCPDGRRKMNKTSKPVSRWLKAAKGLSSPIKEAFFCRRRIMGAPAGLRNSSRLGNGEKNVFRASGTQVAQRPSEWARASQLARGRARSATIPGTSRKTPRPIYICPKARPHGPSAAPSGQRLQSWIFLSRSFHRIPSHSTPFKAFPGKKRLFIFL
jgi:hypothetical protein